MTENNVKRVPTWLWALGWISLLLHLIWIILGLTLYFGPGLAPTPELTDAVAAAYQLGRLDFVSIAVTILAAVLTLGAFGGFFLIRGAAIHAAGEEVSERLPEILPEHLKDEAIKRAILSEPQILHTLASQIRSILENDTLTGRADEIAEAFGGAEDEQ